jgi:hypothetical protein
MIKLCIGCGKTRTIQPRKDSRTKTYTCEGCLSQGKGEVTETSIKPVGGSRQYSDNFGKVKRKVTTS